MSTNRAVEVLSTEVKTSAKAGPLFGVLTPISVCHLLNDRSNPCCRRSIRC